MDETKSSLSRRGLLGLIGSGIGAGILSSACGAGSEKSGERDGAAPPDSDAPEGVVSEDSGTPLEDGGGRPEDAGTGTPEGGPSCTPTTADVEGPYYEPDAPERTKIASDAEPGQRLVISGKVLGPDCQTPLAGALVDIWQADKDGKYHTAEEEYRLLGSGRAGDTGCSEHLGKSA